MAEPQTTTSSANLPPKEEPKKKVATAFFTLKAVIPNRQTSFVPDLDKDGKPKTSGRHLVLSTATYRLKGKPVTNSGPVENVLVEGAELAISGLFEQDWKLGDELKVEISKV